MSNTAEIPQVEGNKKEVSHDDYLFFAQSVANQVVNELIRAKGLFPDFYNSQHEGYAVILEEVEELWAEIKKNQRDYDLQAQRKEAIQAAAMLIRFVVELIDNNNQKHP
jgi:NTP pyrophosphatase (non-canonical NTP hydrolase)